MEVVVVVVVDVFVLAGDVVVSWARRGREAATATAARADRVLSRAACPTGCLFIWCLSIEVITEWFLVVDLVSAGRVAIHPVPSRLSLGGFSEKAGECLGVMGFMGWELKLYP